jgi:hypothetical protein
MQDLCKIALKPAGMLIDEAVRRLIDRGPQESRERKHKEEIDRLRGAQLPYQSLDEDFDPEGEPTGDSLSFERDPPGRERSTTELVLELENPTVKALDNLARALGSERLEILKIVVGSLVGDYTWTAKFRELEDRLALLPIRFDAWEGCQRIGTKPV